LILRYEGNNLSKIIQEIEKLLIIYNFIDEKEIIENITPELEEDIFQIINEILNLRIINAIEKIEILTNETNIYAFYNNFLANLRVSIFIMKLKNE
jgi:DNA polymerase III delta subunit